MMMSKPQPEVRRSTDPHTAETDSRGRDPDPSRAYHRYHIETQPTADVAPYPNRFRVKVGKVGLAQHLLREIVHERFNRRVITSRPCMYGVFSGPIGGFAPRPKVCVGCLRCMTEFPDFVRVSHNPERKLLGDSFFTPSLVDAIMYEAQTGKIPVKGAGYRGPFGGDGWDGMWTDMSEIVRPTRDGIHGREFISTAVHVGDRPSYLTFDEQGKPAGQLPRGFSLPLPMLFDLPPASLTGDALARILVESAGELETLAILPLSRINTLGVHGKHIVPLVTSEDCEALSTLAEEPLMFELSSRDQQLHNEVCRRFPGAVACLRLSFESGFEQRLLAGIDDGFRVFHLVADYHGHNAGGDFILDLIRRAHQTLVRAGRRDHVTLIGGGGIILAEHVPKAIVCGLDVVSIETPLLIALQVAMTDECIDPSGSRWNVPDLPLGWGVQRLKNLLASWHDQLLEVMGAMGLREVRRLRGEMGRAMFQKDLEREAFEGISGYEKT
jgi:hypothetical protein